MKTLYFDCFSGISGDMTVGALIDLGVDFDYLRTEIGKLPIDGFELRLSRSERAEISAAKFDVLVEGWSDHAGGHRHEHGHDLPGTHGQRSGSAHRHQRASEILDMLRQSALQPNVKERAVGIFEKLAVSEGRVHQVPPEDVEFHEVGSIDSIVDVVGAAIGLEALEVDRFLCSPINVGAGFIQCQHGIYPVPAPATANLLEEATIYSKHVDVELVTPTGAAILAGTIDRFGPLDGLAVERVGYGAGTKDFGDFPNCLRLFLGHGPDLQASAEQVTVIETNVDDMSPEALAYASEKLLASGALDVVTIPVLMKKGRPGHLLQVIVPLGREPDLTRIMFEETTTIGVRMRSMSRIVLDRETVEVRTPEGKIRVKVSRLEGRVVNVSPEYEDCARLARECGVPFEDIRKDALREYEKARDD